MQRKFYAPVPPEVERVGKAVLDAAFKAHTALGQDCWSLYTRHALRLN